MALGRVGSYRGTVVAMRKVGHRVVAVAHGMAVAKGPVTATDCWHEDCGDHEDSGGHVKDWPYSCGHGVTPVAMGAKGRAGRPGGHRETLRLHAHPCRTRTATPCRTRTSRPRLTPSCSRVREAAGCHRRGDTGTLSCPLTPSSSPTGHDTTASGLAWLLYNLAHHPDYQERCRQEACELLKGRDVVEVEW